MKTETKTNATNATAPKTTAPKTGTGTAGTAGTTTNTTTTQKKPYTRNTRLYFLYCPGKGFMLKNPKGAPTFGVDGELVRYTDIRQAKFARDFFVDTVRLVDTLDVLTKAN